MIRCSQIDLNNAPGACVIAAINGKQAWLTKEALRIKIHRSDGQILADIDFFNQSFISEFAGFDIDLIEFVRPIPAACAVTSRASVPDRAFVEPSAKLAEGRIPASIRSLAAAFAAGSNALFMATAPLGRKSCARGC